MPIYTYAPYDPCELCRDEFEIQQSLTEKPLTNCDACGKKCRRIITGVALTGKTKVTTKSAKELGFKVFKRKGKGHYVRE